MITLNLDGNPLQDISFLNNLSNLKKLSIELGSGPCNLEGLAKLTNLSGLNLHISQYARIEDIHPLSALANLTYLELNAKISDFSFLKQLKKLKKIKLSRAEIGNLGNLQTLDFAFTKVENLDFAKGLKNLEDIDGAFSLIQDLSPLKNCPELRNANFEHLKSQKPNGKGLNELLDLKVLKRLRVDKGVFGKKALDEFQKQNPKVDLG